MKESVSVGSSEDQQPPVEKLKHNAASLLPWLWVPSLYFAEGVPNEVVANLAGDMYALLGISNQQMTLYTGLLYLPWVIKPLWSPLVDVIGSQRGWIVGTEVALAFGLLGVALSLSTSWFFFATLVFFWLIAISSATHDIAADGLYIDSLPEKQQAFFLGIRTTFYRGAKFFVSGALLAIAGVLSNQLPRQQAWAWTFVVAAALYGILAVYHFVVLPPGNRKVLDGSKSRLWSELSISVSSFFVQKRIGLAVAFLLLYRFSEAQLGKISRPFMFAERAAGGLALSEEEVAVVYGVFGLGMLTLGGILGGLAIAKHGLKRWILPMALAINAPNACYYALAVWLPTDLWLVKLAVAVEQFGYGFGFAAYLMFMLELSRGKHATAHYALCTGLMALGLMLPSMISGGVQETLGYEGFFAYILLATAPSFIVSVIVWRLLPFGASWGEEGAER